MDIVFVLVVYVLLLVLLVFLMVVVIVGGLSDEQALYHVSHLRFLFGFFSRLGYLDLNLIKMGLVIERRRKGTEEKGDNNNF